MTAASAVRFVDLPWEHHVLEQAYHQPNYHEHEDESPSMVADKVPLYIVTVTSNCY